MSASMLSRVGLATAADESVPEPARHRAVLLVVAGLLAAALAVGGWLLLGGSDVVDDVAAAPAASAAQPSATASPSASPAPLRFPDGTVAQDGRDPFAPLYVEPLPGAAVGGGAAPGTAPGPQGTDAAPGAGTGTGTGTGTGVSTGPLPVPGAGAVVLALLRVEGAEPSRTAVFTVDGADVPVAVGESFGPGDALLLLSLQQGPADGGWTAVVQSGQGEPFDVTTGAVVPVP